ncbi:MAG: hypothetical protein ACK4ZD_06175 [Caldimonas sp.]|uniref:hypothetical protein n=1 Tax=Caldimonas sp. TaxID=2838790 RepID=UPI00391A20F5
MAITLSNGTQTLALPDTLAWIDEFTWSPVVQTTEHTVTGALVVDAGVRQAGRQITLEGDADTVWATRALVAELQAWASVPGQTYVLTLRGQQRSVIFDHERGGISATEPVAFFSDPAPTDFVGLSLRFIEV